MDAVSTFKGCTFVAPAGWAIHERNDHVLIQNPDSGCLVLIFEPQRSSGDLEHDARAVFAQMYQGWDYRTGEQRETLSRGYTRQGLEYCRMEATMSTTTSDGRYHLEDGVAMVVQAGGPMVIVAARHNTSMFGHDRCVKYDGWQRFFETLTVTGATLPAGTGDDTSQRIVGRWAMSEGRASGEYIFAANGRYQFAGAIGTSYTTSEYDYDVIHTTASAFQGSGSYSISGDRLTMRRDGGDPEHAIVRFEKVNRGNAEWNDRLYLLKHDPGGDYEVAYERQHS
jgi:hypothetical protein